VSGRTNTSCVSHSHSGDRRDEEFIPASVIFWCAKHGDHSEAEFTTTVPTIVG
jgi:hypothetical protein